MTYAVICISSEDGAGAAEIASLVAERLRYRLIDEDIVGRAAAEAGVSREVVADAERRKSLIERVLETVASAGAGMNYMVAAPMPPISDSPSDEALRGLIRAVIEETATQGEVVIVAHAASLALAERDDVLRALITASPPTRVRRMADALAVDEREAGRLLRRSDTGREDYLKRFYGVERELPTHYDLVINTDRVASPQAAELILHAAEHAAQPA